MTKMPRAEIYNSISFTCTTPDGEATIFIDETSPGNVAQVHYYIGKSGTALAAWANALARMVTFALRSGASLSELREELEDISSDRFVHGHQTRSGPEAMAFAIRNYERHVNARTEIREAAKISLGASEDQS